MGGTSRKKQKRKESDGTDKPAYPTHDGTVLPYPHCNAFAKPTKNINGKTYEFSDVKGRLFDQVIEGVLKGRVYTTQLPPPGSA